MHKANEQKTNFVSKIPNDSSIRIILCIRDISLDMLIGRFR